MRQLLSVLTAALLCWNTAAAGVECGMAPVYLHSDTGTWIYTAPEGIQSIFYTAKMAVNTDGSTRSYHPDDPFGKKIALNNMGNAITGFYDYRGGPSRACGKKRGACFETLISTFEAARDSKYDPRYPWVDTKHIIPWKLNEELGRKQPCRYESGPNKGFFVTQTAYAIHDGDECDGSRYIDALSVNANVLPNLTAWASQGTVTDGFDLVVLYSEETNIITFGVNGDRGPADSIGEVSVAMAAAMRGRNLTGSETYTTGIKTLALDNARYLIFPKVDVKKRRGSGFTQRDIDEIGIQTLIAWGGFERFKSCMNLAVRSVPAPAKK